MSTLSTMAAAQAVATKTAPTMRDLIQAQLPAIEAQLAGAMSSSAFVRAAITTISNSPELQQADPRTVLGAVMLAAQLKLEIGPALGHFYLTPRRVGSSWTCLPIIGYQGYIELAYRSGRIDKIETIIVREGDHFKESSNPDTGHWYDWAPLDSDIRRPLVRVIAQARIKGANTNMWESLTKDEVLARRPSSFSPKGPWVTHEIAMARKTGIRALAPYLPKSAEFASAIEADENQVSHPEGVAELTVTRIEQEAPVQAPAPVVNVLEVSASGSAVV